MSWKTAAFALVTLLGLPLAHARAEKSRSASDGERIFQQRGGCHSVKASKKKVGPSLKGLFKKRNLLNGIPATEQNIRLRIITGGRGMPPFEQILSAKEMDQAGNVILLRKDLLPVLMSSASTLNLILGWW